MAARFDPATWTAPPIFAYLVEQGRVPVEDQYRALNMGIGMVLAVAPEHAEQVAGAISGARIIGEIVAREGDGPVVLGLDTPPATAPAGA